MCHDSENYLVATFNSPFLALSCLSWCRDEGPHGSRGGGAVLLVIKGTAHHTFTDVVPYFHARFGWLTKLVRIQRFRLLH